MADIRNDEINYICRKCQPLNITCKFYKYYAKKCVAYLDD